MSDLRHIDEARKRREHDKRKRDMLAAIVDLCVDEAKQQGMPFPELVQAIFLRWQQP